MEGFLANEHTWVGVGIVVVIGFIIWKKVPHALGKMLDARAEAIAKELDDARKLREEAETLLAQYKEKQSHAEAEAAAIVEEARFEAERYAAEAREALAGQIERRAKVAEDKIAQAEAQALAEVRALAADAAAKAAEQLIAERMSDAHSSDLIKSAIKEIPSKLN